MLVEISARYIAENLPADDTLMPIVAKRFNQQMDYRWQRIIDFLKLHYMLTKRPEPYWQAHCVGASIPESLVISMFCMAWVLNLILVDRGICISNSNKLIK